MRSWESEVGESREWTMDNSEKEKLNIVLYYFLLYAYIVIFHLNQTTSQQAINYLNSIPEDVFQSIELVVFFFSAWYAYNPHHSTNTLYYTSNGKTANL